MLPEALRREGWHIKVGIYLMIFTNKPGGSLQKPIFKFGKVISHGFKFYV